MVTPEGTLYCPDFRVVFSFLSAVFSDDFYFTAPVFEGKLVCVCKNGAFTQIVLLTGSSFEMQHGSYSSVFQLLKEISSGGL